MEQHELDELRIELTRRRERLMDEQRRQIGAVERSADHVSADDCDRAVESHEFDIAVETAFRHGNEIEAVDRALSRIEDGTYGQCEDCGDSIAAPRLRALPFAALCIDCQRAMETHGGYAHSAFDDESSWKPGA